MTQSLSMSRRGLIGVAGASVLGAPLLMARTATAQTNQAANFHGDQTRHAA